MSTLIQDSQLVRSLLCDLEGDHIGQFVTVKKLQSRMRQGRFQSPIAILYLLDFLEHTQQIYRKPCRDGWYVYFQKPNWLF